MTEMAIHGGDKSGDLPGRIQRLDRWLWFSRVLKSRTMAAQLVENGKVRVNRARVVKPRHAVRAGDVLTIALRGRVQVLRILAVGARRGPPQEARQLYQVLGDVDASGAPVADPSPVADRQSKPDRRPAARPAEQE